MLIVAEEKLSQNGLCPISLWQFNEQAVLKFPRIAQIGKRILCGAVVLQFSGILIEVTSLPDQVERNICDGDILLQYRSMPAPFAVAMTEEESGICQVKSVF